MPLRVEDTFRSALAGRKQKGNAVRPLAGMWVYKGDTVHADYGPLGSVTCRFE